MDKKEPYDFVIIGGGLGGLVCANILAINNKRVCVLEKNKKIGGNLQTFTRNGCVFDTGMHYIGSYDKGQPLYQIFSYLGLVGRFRVQRLDDEGYDVVSIGDFEFRLPTGYDNLFRSLTARFPEEENAIRTYVETIRRIGSRVNNLNMFVNEQEKQSFFFSYNDCAFEFIESLTHNKLLKAVMAGNNGLYCGNSAKTSVNLLAITNNFYLGSAWRMLEGGHKLAEAIRQNIENLGGVVLAGKEVTRLVFNEKRVAFAGTVDGESYSAENFISDVHPAVSLKWIEPGKLSKAYIDRINHIENTTGAFVLYLVLEKGTIRHRNGNLYYSVDENVWDLNRIPGVPWPHGFMLYTTRHGATDFAESITAVTMMDYREVEPWDHTRTGKRGPDYEAFKKGRMNALLDLIARKMPEVKGRVLRMYAATPLTFRDYTGTVNGSMYGIEKDCRNAMRTFISVKTKIPNFCFTGQNINNHGMLGVTIGALMTSANFIDIVPVIEAIKKSGHE